MFNTIIIFNNLPLQYKFQKINNYKQKNIKIMFVQKSVKKTYIMFFKTFFLIKFNLNLLNLKKINVVDNLHRIFFFFFFLLNIYFKNNTNIYLFFNIKHSFFFKFFLYFFKYIHTFFYNNFFKWNYFIFINKPNFFYIIFNKKKIRSIKKNKKKKLLKLNKSLFF